MQNPNFLNLIMHLMSMDYVAIALCTEYKYKGSIMDCIQTPCGRGREGGIKKLILNFTILTNRLALIKYKNKSFIWNNIMKYFLYFKVLRLIFAKDNSISKQEFHNIYIFLNIFNLIPHFGSKCNSGKYFFRAQFLTQLFVPLN